MVMVSLRPLGRFCGTGRWRGRGCVCRCGTTGSGVSECGRRRGATYGADEVEDYVDFNHGHCVVGAGDDNYG